MITVKLYGLLRLESGIKERRLEGETLSDVMKDLEGQGISRKELKGCIVLVNGKAAKMRERLKDGDVVQLMSPVAGG